MKMTVGMFSSSSEHWATPKVLFQVLDAEFHFNDDPCPLHGVEDGLSREWGSSTFINPPYGKAIVAWMKKALEESQKGKLVVCLVPSRTDTRWWHDNVMKATEIRFLKGRLKFGDSKNSAPFPSVVVIFRPAARSMMRTALSAIVHQTAAEWGFQPEDLIGRSRLPTTVLARDAAAYEMRSMIPRPSLREIGEALGDREPRTILHSLRKTERWKTRNSTI